MRALLNELSNIVPAAATASAQSMRTTSPLRLRGPGAGYLGRCVRPCTPLMFF
jgi:hypothetical protein